MTFALFFLGEYANMILMSALTVVLFLGRLVGTQFDHAVFTWIPALWFILKTILVLFAFLWVRATFPHVIVTIN